MRLLQQMDGAAMGMLLTKIIYMLCFFPLNGCRFVCLKPIVTEEKGFQKYTKVLSKMLDSLWTGHGKYFLT